MLNYKKVNNEKNDYNLDICDSSTRNKNNDVNKFGHIHYKNEYLQRIENLSNLKKAKFLKDREKCLEITTTEENDNYIESKRKECFSSQNINFGSITPSNENKVKSTFNTPQISPGIVSKGNLIKTNLKIKIIKESINNLGEDIKHKHKRSINISI